MKESERCSYRIAGGRVIDPASGRDGIGDVYIRNSRVVVPGVGEEQADTVIDATGCLVLPGLIDFHMHVNRGHGDHGANPDVFGLPNGVTSAVDPGSTGTANFEGFYKDVVCRAELTIKSFLHLSAIGVTTIQHPENPDPAIWDLRLLEYLMERYYPEQIIGFKLRMGKPICPGYGLSTLEDALALAERFQVPLCLHVVEPEQPYSHILPLLRSGDMLCHCFQGQGYAITDERGVIAEAREARERGVIFDAAPARRNYNFSVVRRALRDGFPPDVIGTDLVAQSAYDKMLFSLPYVLSAFLAAGMPLLDVVGAVTQTPARLMGLAGQVGTLRPGALADVAILQVRETPVTFTDPFGNAVHGDRLLVPVATFKAGRCMFMRIDFAF